MGVEPAGIVAREACAQVVSARRADVDPLLQVAAELLGHIAGLVKQVPQPRMHRLDELLLLRMMFASELRRHHELHPQLSVDGPAEGSPAKRWHLRAAAHAADLERLRQARQPSVKVSALLVGQSADPPKEQLLQAIGAGRDGLLHGEGRLRNWKHCVHDRQSIAAPQFYRLEADFPRCRKGGWHLVPLAA
eukprot:3602992-Lingulodinium_polyedra.AAC.2